jgi:hypothetical protein
VQADASAQVGGQLWPCGCDFDLSVIGEPSIVGHRPAEPPAFPEWTIHILLLCYTSTRGRRRASAFAGWATHILLLKEVDRDEKTWFVLVPDVAA